MTEPKRIVLWGTGVVGSMVMAEVLDGHPAFELVGVGVSNPDKVGKDAAELCGRTVPSGVLATDLFPMTLMGLCGRVDSVRASCRRDG